MCSHSRLPSLASLGELDTMRRAAEGLRLRGELAAARRTELAIARLRAIRASADRCRCSVAPRVDEDGSVRAMAGHDVPGEQEASVSPGASPRPVPGGAVADVGLTAADWFFEHAVRMRAVGPPGPSWPGTGAAVPAGRGSPVGRRPAGPAGLRRGCPSVRRRILVLHPGVDAASDPTRRRLTVHDLLVAAGPLVDGCSVGLAVGHRAPLRLRRDGSVAPGSHEPELLRVGDPATPRSAASLRWSSLSEGAPHFRHAPLVPRGTRRGAVARGPRDRARRPPCNGPDERLGRSSDAPCDHLPPVRVPTDG